eukprot:Pgem_evm1s17125
MKKLPPNPNARSQHARELIRAKVKYDKYFNYENEYIDVKVSENGETSLVAAKEIPKGTCILQSANLTLCEPPVNFGITKKKLNSITNTICEEVFQSKLNEL